MSNVEGAKMSGSVSQVDVNIGWALFQAAEEYPTLMAVLYELVQNSIDARATKIRLDIDQSGNSLTVMDNGDGISTDTFQRALLSVCRSIKEPGKLGRWGKGNVSPLGKCREFRFTSCSPETGEYTEWLFDCQRILDTERNLTIPKHLCASLRFDDGTAQARKLFKKKNIEMCPWKSRTQLFDVTTDRVISRINIEELIENILDKYRLSLLENGTVIDIVHRDRNGRIQEHTGIKAKKYSGRKMAEFVYTGSDVGKVSFQLFLNPNFGTKGKRSGRVQFGVVGDSFRVNVQNFMRAGRSFLDKSVVEALASGLFQGDITATNIILHPGRASFVQNDAFVELCIALQEWYEQIGKKVYTVTKEVQRDQRFQDLGRQSLQSLRHILQNPELILLKEALQYFSVGNVGDGHVEVPENIVTGKSSRMIESRRPKKNVERDERSSSASGNGSRERQEHDGHVPFTSCGPRGRERKLVRDNSIGLVFDYIAMEGSDDLWILSQNGVLSFNIRHPDWVAVESSDRKVMALQEFCALQALAACCLSDDARASVGEFIDLITHGFVSLLRASPAYGAKTQQKESDPE